MARELTPAIYLKLLAHCKANRLVLSVQGDRVEAYDETDDTWTHYTPEDVYRLLGLLQSVPIRPGAKPKRIGIKVKRDSLPIRFIDHLPEPKSGRTAVGSQLRIHRKASS